MKNWDSFSEGLWFIIKLITHLHLSRSLTLYRNENLYLHRNQLPNIQGNYNSDILETAHVFFIQQMGKQTLVHYIVWDTTKKYK